MPALCSTITRAYVSPPFVDKVLQGITELSAEVFDLTQH
jgi:hypothetical protein